MSRSFKKNPVVKDSGSKKWVKREASKSVRRFRGVIANGGAFRKIFCSWDINDYISRTQWNAETAKHLTYMEWKKYYLFK